MMSGGCTCRVDVHVGWVGPNCQNTALDHLFQRQGFIQSGGGPGIPPSLPPSHNFSYPEILKLSMVIILAIMCHQNVWKFCPRLQMKQSWRYNKFKIFMGGGGGACPQTPPQVGMHAFHTLLSSCYHPVSHQLKILYETLSAVSQYWAPDISMIETTCLDQ